MSDLARRLSKGDAEAYAQLYDACADRLFAYVTMRLESTHAAADVVQKTFLRLARSSRRFKSVSDPVAYAFIVARNETHRWLTSKQRERKQRRRWAESRASAEVSADNDPLVMSEWAATALGRISASQQEIVQLRFYGGLTFAEIAAVLDVPQGTVATRYRAAIARLRVCLERESM